jgi:creatinine deaminase
MTCSRGVTTYSSSSPCSMCTGAILLYKIPRVVVGENTTFLGDEELLRTKGVEVMVKDNEECRKLLQRFIQEKPEVSLGCPFPRQTEWKMQGLG